MKSTQSLAKGLKREAERRRNNPSVVYGYANYGYESGQWPILNAVTGGIHDKKMQMLFAREKHGKSMLISGLLPLIAEQCPPEKRVRIVSLEMTAKAYMRRMAAIMANVDSPTRIQQGIWDDENMYDNYLAALDALGEMPFEFRDEASTLDDIEEFIANEEAPTFYWVLDHVGLVSMNIVGGRNGVPDHIGTANGLMRICHTHATGMMVGHANRAGAGGVPALMNIAGTDQFGKNLDEAWALWRLMGHGSAAGVDDDDEDFESEGEQELQQGGEPAILRITQRDGAGGDVMLWWSKKKAHFVEVPKDLADQVHNEVLAAEKKK